MKSLSSTVSAHGLSKLPPDYWNRYTEAYARIYSYQLMGVVREELFNLVISASASRRIGRECKSQLCVSFRISVVSNSIGNARFLGSDIRTETALV